MRARDWWQWIAVAALLLAGAGAAAAEDDTTAGYPMGTMGGCPMMGMGPGMGMGSGMMGGGMGMGPGMGMMSGGMGPYGMLDLSADQRGRINKIHDEARRKNWATLGKIHDEQAKLRDLYAADKRDTKAIVAVVAGIQALERQMLETMLDAHNRMDALLTDAQREQLRQFRSDRPGMGGMHRGMMGR
jgi:Spy/CpxP family protein refolding chaperone